MDVLAIIVPICAVAALIVAYALASWIGKLDVGTDRMSEISGYIRVGAMAFLKREYKYMAVVIVVIFGTWNFHQLVDSCFCVRALFSVLAGFFGMTVATKAMAHSQCCKGWRMPKGSQGGVSKRCRYGPFRRGIGHADSELSLWLWV